LVGIGQAFTQPEHISWIAKFLGYAYFAIPTSWLLSYTIGTLTFATLRTGKKEYTLCYCAAAALAGFSYGMMIGGAGQRAIAGAIMAALAVSAALVFALIRGPDRQMSRVCKSTA
jgi:hypothetical protein